MKKLILALLSTIGLVLNGNSQEQDLHVVASAGASYQSVSNQLDWTLGEIIIHTLESNSSMLSQGFHQPNTNLVSVRPLTDDIETLLVWPNPFKDEFTFSLTLKSPYRGEAELYDVAGNLIWTNSFEGNIWQQVVLLPSLPSGQYVLMASFTDDSNNIAYPMIKTQ